MTVFPHPSEVTMQAGQNPSIGSGDTVLQTGYADADADPYQKQYVPLPFGGGHNNSHSKYKYLLNKLKFLPCTSMC